MQPRSADLGSKGTQSSQISWDGVIVQVSLNDSLQPLSYLRYRVMTVAHQVLADGLQPGAHALCRGEPPDSEALRPLGSRADVREPEKVERLRSTLTASSAAVEREASKLYDPCLFIIERQAE